MASNKRKKNIFWNDDHHSFSKFAVVATAIFLVIVTFSRGGLLNWGRAKYESARQKRQIENYESEIKAMDKEIDLLTTNKDSLEKFAREEFHFASPGDDVYIEKN
ncbi:MAG: septum formation initiator family protein [Bacteroidales bacterium]|jgi:cell division protein FtsB|nr:septum formation initiator family protein [Bacteroidales bacterium]MBQ1842914.1 septum formation initiator family protein [Bacteroidales bacterium]MBQ2549955.1 septum formation initiator family protein [Bacteroidales bacterium]